MVVLLALLRSRLSGSRRRSIAEGVCCGVTIHSRSGSWPSPAGGHPIMIWPPTQAKGIIGMTLLKSMSSPTAGGPQQLSSTPMSGRELPPALNCVRDTLLGRRVAWRSPSRLHDLPTAGGRLAISVAMTFPEFTARGGLGAALLSPPSMRPEQRVGDE